MLSSDGDYNRSQEMAQITIVFNDCLIISLAAFQILVTYIYPHHFNFRHLILQHQKLCRRSENYILIKNFIRCRNTTSRCEGEGSTCCKQQEQMALLLRAKISRLSAAHM